MACTTWQMSLRRWYIASSLLKSPIMLVVVRHVEPCRNDEAAYLSGDIPCALYRRIHHVLTWCIRWVFMLGSDCWVGFYKTCLIGERSNQIVVYLGTGKGTVGLPENRSLALKLYFPHTEYENIISCLQMIAR